MQKPSRLALLVFLVLLVLQSAPSLIAQSSEAIFFSVKLSTDNEVPRGQDAAMGSGRIELEITRDAAGDIASGTVRFVVAFQFSTTVTLTGLHLHSGGIGENGAVAIDAHLGQTAEPNGTGMVEVVTPPVTSPEQISVLKGLINAPHLYYVDLHTSTAPNGAISRANNYGKTLVEGRPLFDKSYTIADQFRSGSSVLMTLDITRDAAGKISFGSVMLDAEYRFPTSITVTGLQLHSGRSGQNGEVVVDVGPLNLPNATGTGRVTKIISLPTDPTTLATITAIVRDPSPYYAEICTTDSRREPCGAS